MTNEKIADKIRKVLAKAEGTDNEAEQELFIQKAQDLLLRHNLSMLDLNNLDREDPVATDYQAVKFRVNDSWMRNLGAAVARFYGCRPIIGHDPYSKHTKFVHIVGRESNRVTFKLMIPFIKKQVNAIGRKLYTTDPSSYKSERAAARAVANALTFRVHGMTEQQEKKERQRVEKGMTALVPLDLIEAVIAQDFPTLGKGRKTRISTNQAAAKAAQGVSLYRQTGGTDNQRMIK